MAIDGIFLRQLTQEIQTLLPCKINKIHAVSNTEVLFTLRSNRAKKQLLISTHSIYNRINITDKSYPTPTTPSNFIMLLRKYLEGGLLMSVEQGGLDRYLHFVIKNFDELGDEANRHLYVELMGKYANIILVNDDNKIIDALKRIPPFENSQRTIQPGAIFKLPIPQQNKVDPFQAIAINPEVSLVQQFEGFSPLLSLEVEYRINNQEPFSQIMQEIANSQDIYIYKVKDQFVFHCLKLKHIPSEYIQMNLSEGLDYVYYTLEEKDRIRQQTGDLFKFVRRELKKINNKIDKLTDSLEQANNCDIYRLYGDLLYSNLHLVKKGASNVEVIDYNTDKVIEIPLDNKLDGKQNAKKNFQKYTKGKNGLKYINEQLALSRKELEYFENLDYQLSKADFYDAKEIQEELVNNKYIKIGKYNQKKKKKNDAPMYKSLLSPDGHNIYYGKNNIQNDYLTFKKAKRNDYWFHVKDYHGTHLIIDCDELSETDLRYCAKLAAYNSDASNSASIPVNYCLVKEIKKIPQGKLGMVTMNHYKTIYIDLDEDFLNTIPKEQ